MKNRSVRQLKDWFFTYTVAVGLLPLPVKVVNGIAIAMIGLSMASAYAWNYSIEERDKVKEAMAERMDAIAFAEAKMTTKEYYFVRSLYSSIKGKGQWKEEIQATLSQYPLVVESMQDGQKGGIDVQVIGDVANYMDFVAQLQRRYPFLIAQPKRVEARDRVVHIDYTVQALPLDGKAMYNKK